jgi:hypothetical protein
LARQRPAPRSTGALVLWTVCGWWWGGRHPKVDLLVESLAAGVVHEGAGGVGGGGAGLADQAELSGSGCGFGAVGRAELVQDVADVLLDGVEGDHQLGGDPPVRLAGGQ